MILCNILIPIVPNAFETLPAAWKIKYVSKRQRKIDNTKIVFLIKVSAEFDKIIADEIDPGPAMNGIANGVNAKPSFNKASSSSMGVDFIRDIFDSRLDSPILKKIMPPAILNASIVIPYIEKINSPIKEKRSKIIPAAINPFLLICVRSFLVMFWVIVKYIGRIPNGLIRTSNELKHKIPYWK